MLYGAMVKEFKLFTFYRTINSIDYSAHQDSLMLMDIAAYHQQLKDLWEIQPAQLMFTNDEAMALQAGETVSKFSTEDFLAKASELSKRGKELIEFYPKLIPDCFIRDTEPPEIVENRTPLIQEPKDD